jgi:hypothetical protein
VAIGFGCRFRLQAGETSRSDAAAMTINLRMVELRRGNYRMSGPRQCR